MDTGFYPAKPLDTREKQAVKRYFQEESESRNAEIFKKKHFQILRDHVVRLICKHSRSENEKFDAYIPYLAVEYFDRFISRNPLPIIGDKDLNYRALILSICCLSLAWKMRKVKPTYDIFLDFDNRLILEIEYEILYGLQWKMCSVNAFCFVRYFMSLALFRGLTFRRISEIIIQAQGDIYFTEFRSSVLAASAILTAIHFQNKDMVDVCRDKLTKGKLVELNEGEVTRCTRSMIEMTTDGGKSNVGDDDSTILAYKMTESIPAQFFSETGEKEILNLDFELKWIKDDHDENLLMTLNPALFL